jgi:hypothetical protein
LRGFLSRGFDNAIGGQQVCRPREIFKRRSIFRRFGFQSLSHGRATLRLNTAGDFYEWLVNVLCKLGVQHLDALQTITAHARDAIACE